MPFISSTLSLSRIFGLRGDQVTVAATLAAKAGVGGRDVRFTWHSDFHHSEQSIGTAKTDARGLAKLPWTIPTSPQDDNVIMTAVYTQPEIIIPEAEVPASAKASRRVEIGTRT